MSVYPWDKWLNGQAWELRPGRDFSTLALLSRAAHTAAAKRKLKGGSLVIYTTRRGTVVLQYAYKQKPVKYAVPRFGNRRVDQAVEMREQGVTYDQIAKRFGVSRQRVQQMLTSNRQGLTFILIDKHAIAHPNERKGRRYGHSRGEI